MGIIVPERHIGSILGAEEVEAVARVIKSGSLSHGPDVRLFEQEFAAYVGAKHAVSLNSCTSALGVCARLLRLGPGDEVIATPQTFWASVAALVERNVTVRFADINPATLNIDPSTIERHITPRTRAIYVTHYGGNPVDMDEVTAIARAHKLVVVEDCAHAAGAEYNGRKIGKGDLCCFSFQSLKNMTTLGEGGMLTTENDEWANEARRFRIMGLIGETKANQSIPVGMYEKKPDFALFDTSAFPPMDPAFQMSSWDAEVSNIVETGTKCYMTAVQAAVGRVQLQKLDKHNAARTQIAARYNEAIARVPGLKKLFVPNRNKSSWHLFTFFVDPNIIDRNEFIEVMQTMHGVQVMQRYWPLHLHAALRGTGHRAGEAPVCGRVWFDEQVALPISASMTEQDVHRVIVAVIDAADKCRSMSAARTLGITYRQPG